MQKIQKTKLQFKNQKTKAKLFKDSKKGVTLLLAILTMSLVIFLVMLVARYFLVEFKMTKGIGDSVRAYYIAETGIEHGLYILKTGANLTLPYTADFAGGSYTLEINSNGEISATGSFGGIPGVNPTITRKLDIKKRSILPPNTISNPDGSLTSTFKRENDSNISSFVQDAYVDSRDPDKNYGKESYLYAVTGSTTNSIRQASLIKFDLSYLPQNAEITNAYLHLFFNGYYNSLSHLQNIRVYRITTDWTETGVNWSNKPGHAGSQTAEIATSSSNTSYGYDWKFDVTNDVKDFLNGSKVNFGWWIQTDLTNPGKGNIYFSSEASDVSKRPYLEIKYRLP